MDMTTLAAAQTSIKALFGLVKGATSAVVDHELKAKLIDIQAGILDAQGKLGDAQAERLELLNEINILRDKVRSYENAKAALDSYTLHEVAPGRYLYKYAETGEEKVDHFACPPCHNAGKISVLQSPKTGSKQVTYICKTCRFSLAVGESDPIRVSRRSDWLNNY